MSAGKRICSVRHCGRPVKALRLCQTHWKYFKKTGKVGGAIDPKRPGRKGTIRVNGHTFTAECADTLKRHAEKNGLSVTAVITDVLEGWAFRRNKRKA